MPTFRINTASLSAYAGRLERMNKYDLPIVVRQTLTAAAFRTKKETMPAEAEVFVHRKATFFQANSKAIAAQGLDINAMRSVAAFVAKPGDRSHSVEDLEQQETGGVIGNRSLIALSTARAGGVWQGLTENRNRRAALANKVFDSKDATGKSPEQKFIHAAYDAAQVGGIVIGNRVNSKGNKIAWRVKKPANFGHDKHRMVLSFNTKYVTTQAFAVKKDRKVHPKATRFMEKASVESQMGMEADFIKFATVRFLK